MNIRKIKIPLFLIKIFNFEFWPYWIFYIPILPYYFYLAARSKSVTFFSNVNPKILMGGVVGESKMDILNMVAKEYKPITIGFEGIVTIEQIKLALNSNGLNYPIILKPNIGERGNGVEKIENEIQLSNYLNNSNKDLIVQEFIDYTIELGVLFYKIPDSIEYGITSIVSKGFLEVIGDGESTIKQLLEENTRARFVIEDLLTRLENQANTILPKGVHFYPQPIGNHCKGTKFIDSNNLITNSVNEIFYNIVNQMDEFYYGRFDLKVKSIADFNLGKNIKIMEVNGVTSEPGHIYDPGTKLIKAYQSLMAHMKLVYRIAKVNKNRGYQYTSWSDFYQLMKNFYSNKA